jgi:hypothetical protein
MKVTLLPRAGDNPKQSVTEMEEVPMKLNDSISTYDVAEALQGESGKFEVTSPNGERYFVTTQPGHSIVSLEWAGSEPNLQPFLVRKVAQPIATEGRSKRSAAA